MRLIEGVFVWRLGEMTADRLKEATLRVLDELLREQDAEAVHFALLIKQRESTTTV